MENRWTPAVVLLLAVAAQLFTAACTDPDFIINSTPPDVVHGNGLVVEESRAVSPFSDVDLAGVGTVYLRQGAREELLIRAEENLLEYLRTDVHAGELAIWRDAVTFFNTRPIEYHLTVVDLDHITLSGAGRIEGTDFDFGSLALVLSGAGDIELGDLGATTLEIDNFGVGDVTLAGLVAEQTVRLRSYGEYDGRDLTSVEADVRLVDGGSATVRVRDHLTATVEGSGSVYYIGDPTVERSINGSGDVVQIGG